MRNYGNGKIYKIVCGTTGKVYVGSTTKTYLSQRLFAHYDAYCKHLQGYGSRLTRGAPDGCRDPDSAEVDS